ncbi:VOC family protein [Myxococcota bacterium]|nr:VOC family protein [Myxococcota bacterium]
MKRVTGIGGIFFKAADPQALAAWYQRHLGVDVQPWGGATFRWSGPDNPQGAGTTVWSPFPADTAYFAPSQASFMINYRVEDLHGLLAVLRAEGVVVEEKVEESEFGKFGWVVDPEGNKVELWEPPAGG